MIRVLHPTEGDAISFGQNKIHHVRHYVGRPPKNFENQTKSCGALTSGVHISLGQYTCICSPLCNGGHGKCFILNQKVIQKNFQV